MDKVKFMLEPESPPHPLQSNPHKLSKVSKKEWSRHCQAWSTSSLSKAAYCRQHKLSIDNFYYWSRSIPNPQAKAPPQSSLFSQVRVNKPTSSVGERIALTLHFPTQLRLTMTLMEDKVLNLISELNNAHAIIR